MPPQIAFRPMPRKKSIQPANEFARFAGQTFSEAFAEFVLGNTEFRELANAIRSEPLSLSETIENWYFPGTSRALWPVAFEDVDFTHVRAWFREPKANSDRERPSASYVSAVNALRDKYAELIGGLRDAKIMGVGHTEEKAVPIDPRYWKQSNCWIDVKTNEFREIKPKHVLWRVVTLELSSSGVNSHAGSVVGSRGGRQPKYAWEDALDRVILRMTRVGLTNTQAELIQFFVDAFHQMPSDAPDESTIRAYLTNTIPRTLAAIKGDVGG